MEYKKLYHFQDLGKPSFITFRTIKNFILNDAAKKIALQYCSHWHKQRIFLYAAVVMPDHVHMLFTTLEDNSGKVFMNEIVLKNIKGASARAINLFLERESHVWQKGYFDTLIRNEEMLRQKVAYIINNPVLKGLVKKPDDYQFVWRHWVEGELKVDAATGMSQLPIQTHNR
jgi:REP element-mobilizing transposase RayT